MESYNLLRSAVAALNTLRPSRFLMSNSKKGRTVIIPQTISGAPHPLLLDKCMPHINSQCWLGWFSGLLQTNSKGHHHQVAPYICSRKALWLIDVNYYSEALPHQNIVNLIVVFPIWNVPLLSGL